MCRYCRHLKELKKSDKEMYEGIIRKWKKLCLREEQLLGKCLVYLSFPPSEVGFIDRVKLADEIINELRKECV